MSLKDEIILGEAARQIADNQAFQKAFKDIEDGLLLSLRQTGLNDEKAREKIVAYYALLHKLKDALLSTIDAGKFAQSSLELEKKQKGWSNLFKSAA